MNKSTVPRVTPIARTVALMVALLVAFPSVTLAGADVDPLPQTAPQPPASDVVTIHLKDGNSLRARISSQNDERIEIVTVGGVAMTFPRSAVERIETAAEAESAGRVSDSNTTRLLFSPTGRPLKKGEGYFSDHYIVFPGVAYGITDNFSLGGGVSVIPGLGLGEQIFFIAPRFGKQFSDRFAASAGYLFSAGGEDNDDGWDLGVGFAMATFGPPDKSLTIGGGLARTTEDESDFVQTPTGYRWETRRRTANTPIVLVGGTARLSKRIAFVSENWLIFHDDFKLSQQPFMAGLRFLGDRLSADVGVILVGELIDEGFPIPWLSMTYHFGKK